MDYFKIGQKIRKYRKAKGLSQEKLAETVGISVTHMSHIETGNTKLSLPVFVDLANALEVQTDDLLIEEHHKRTLTEKEIESLLLTCDARQLKIILDVLRATKNSLDKYL